MIGLCEEVEMRSFTANTLIKRMSRSRRQLGVRDPDLLLLLPLLARPHRHAPILQTKPVDTSTLSTRESKLAPRAVREIASSEITNLTRAEIPKAADCMFRQNAAGRLAKDPEGNDDDRGCCPFCKRNHLHERVQPICSGSG